MRLGARGEGRLRPRTLTSGRPVVAVRGEVPLDPPFAPCWLAGEVELELVNDSRARSGSSSDFLRVRCWAAGEGDLRCSLWDVWILTAGGWAWAPAGDDWPLPIFCGVWEGLRVREDFWDAADGRRETESARTHEPANRGRPQIGISWGLSKLRLSTGWVLSSDAQSKDGDSPLDIVSCRPTRTVRGNGSFCRPAMGMCKAEDQICCCALNVSLSV